MSRQDEKNQKILRALLQEPGNRKCADCGAKGPVYANVSHNTFVCTTCSGIHREFNHRVKSISMATFKPEEIKALQEGGNEAHKAAWLARWSSDDYPEPTAGDEQSIRRFIRLKYIDKKWYKAPKKTAKKEEEPKAEPLTSILGSNIPPLRVDSTVNDSKIAHFAAFENNSQQSDLFSLNTSSSSTQNPQDFNPFAPETPQHSSTNGGDFNPFASEPVARQAVQQPEPIDIFKQSSAPQQNSSHIPVDLFGPTPVATPVQQQPPQQPVQPQVAKKPLDLNTLYQQQAVQNQMRMQAQMGMGQPVQPFGQQQFGQPGQQFGQQPPLQQFGQPGQQFGQPQQFGQQQFGQPGQHFGQQQPPFQQFGQPPLQQFGHPQQFAQPQQFGQPFGQPFPQQYGQPPMQQFGQQPFGQPYGQQPLQYGGSQYQTPVTQPVKEEPAKPDPFASLVPLAKGQATVPVTPKPANNPPANDWPF